MRFVRLVVDRFQGIEHAEVDFGRGLNVLHGPNDIGKSTLATAMRAALLLPSTAAEASEYMPWQGDYTPTVQLTLCDPKGVHYRVTKSFGGGTRSAAKLEWSRTGVDFDIDASGRQVEEKLRALLDWGIPAPGGKAGGKGLPKAFLSRVLLGAQTDVDAILDSSFEDDPEETGRVRLTTALQAFAQDPRFKAVLDQAQAKVDDLFTATGQRKRGKGSPFLAAAEEIKKLQTHLQSLQERQEESHRAQARVQTLLAELQALRERCDEETEVLRSFEKYLGMAEARRVAAAEMERAESDLGSIEAQWAAVTKKAGDVKALEEALIVLTTAHEKADALLAGAKAALDSATEELRRETSDEAALARDLQKAETQNAIAKSDAAASALLAKKKDLEDAARCSKALADVETLRGTKQRERTLVAQKAAAAVAAEQDAAARLRRLEELQAYARWVAATGAHAAAVSSGEKVRQLDAKARALQTEADRLLVEAGKITLPAADKVKAIETLEQELAVAEATLGGGLSISVRPAKGVDVQLRADGAARALPGVGESLEASRTFELAIPGVVELEVFVGAAEARRRAEALRRQWALEARPLLEEAGVANAAELRAARDGADELTRKAAQLTSERLSIEREANAQRVDTAHLDDLGRRAAELEAALGGFNRSALAALYAGVRPGWETDVEKTRKGLEEAKARSGADLLESKSTSGRLDGEILQLEASLKTHQASLKDAMAKAGGDPAALLPALLAQEEQVRRERRVLETKLVALGQGGSAAADAARLRVKAAEEAIAKATLDQKAAADELGRNRSLLDQARGEYSAQKANAERLGRDAAVEQVKARRAALDALPVPPHNTTPEECEARRQRVKSLSDELQAKREELSKAEGALTHVGGAVVAEQCEEVRSALEEATNRQRSLDTDAQAWRLLREVLRESESVGMKHLGRVLGDEVGRRFQDLTGQRYGSLDLGPQGNTVGVQVAGSARSVFSLSVGTREQLATLLRLAIAETLGSAIVLDDHLVEADPARLSWFLEVLQRSAEKIQVIVLTCRRRDYESAADGATAWVDGDRSIRRWAKPGSVA